MSVNFSEVYRKIELTVEKTSLWVSNLADESFLLKFTGHNHESILKTNINIHVYRYGGLSRLRGRIGLLSFGVKLSDDFSLRKSFTAQVRRESWSESKKRGMKGEGAGGGGGGRKGLPANRMILKNAFASFPFFCSRSNSR